MVPVLSPPGAEDGATADEPEATVELTGPAEKTGAPADPATPENTGAAEERAAAEEPATGAESDVGGDEPGAAELIGLPEKTGAPEDTGTPEKTGPPEEAGAGKEMTGVEDESALPPAKADDGTPGGAAEALGSTVRKEAEQLAPIGAPEALPGDAVLIGIERLGLTMPDADAGVLDPAGNPENWRLSRGFASTAAKLARARALKERA